MASVATILSAVRMEWDIQPSPPRTDLTRGSWEEGINRTLGYLFHEEPNRTSRAVLLAFMATGRTTVITPEAEPIRGGQQVFGRNASANPDDPLKATAPGKEPERGSGRGTGGGSNSAITFTPQDWSPVSATRKLDIVDEVLLHEIVHALRQASGVEDNARLAAPIERMRRGDGSVSELMSNTAGGPKPDKHSQIYNNLEEFAAVLITNVYRSENEREGLVRDHLGDNLLTWPMTNPRNFLTVWRKEINRLCSEMRPLCDQIAAVPCAFNPIFELYQGEDRFLPGGRQLRRA